MIKWINLKRSVLINDTEHHCIDHFTVHFSFVQIFVGSRDLSNLMNMIVLNSFQFLEWEWHWNKMQVKVILMYLLVVQSDLYQEVTSQSGTVNISTTGNSRLIKRPPNCSFFKSPNPISLNYCYKNHGTSLAEAKTLTKMQHCTSGFNMVSIGGLNLRDGLFSPNLLIY